ncbi:hypothetical protein O3P69_000158 [Scylla paramamosain]|uniref:Hexosyltransferase n=1 Tax=Scylla paramamosain TaxID=85552 RepID=A0AAW0UZW1_SCYPA
MREWRPYLRWALRLLLVGVAGVVGAALFTSSLLIVSSGAANEALVEKASSQTPPVAAPVSDTAEPLPRGNPGSKIPPHLKNRLYFSSYDGTHVYENRGTIGGTVARKPNALERRMFAQAQEEVVRYLTTRGQHHYSRVDCGDIRYRLLPTAGLEVEVMCSKSSSPEAERVVLLLPFQHSRVLRHTHVAAAQVLGVIVPLQGLVEALERLVTNFREVVQDSDLRVVLSIVYFDDQHTLEAAAALEAARGTEGLQTQFTVLTGEFSRSRGVNVGVEAMTSDVEIVFLCDVDVSVTRDFLVRCLASPAQGREVFFPVLFSQHNPILTYAARGLRARHSGAVKLKDNHGFWRLWGFGMVCLYRTDYLTINGFDSLLDGWGGEDLRFARRVSNMKYTITRSLDHGLRHHYHPKDCSRVGKGQRAPCLRAQAMCEASGQTFGLWYFKHKHNTSMWETLKDHQEIQEEETEGRNERQKEKEAIEDER